MASQRNVSRRLLQGEEGEADGAEGFYYSPPFSIVSFFLDPLAGSPFDAIDFERFATSG